MIPYGIPCLSSRLAHATCALLFAWVLLKASGAQGQDAQLQHPDARLLSQVRFDQRLDEQVPLDLAFRDEANQRVRLGSYFGQRPVVLALVYYRCPKLCNQVLMGMVSAIRAIDLQAGDDFEVVVVSIDPQETPLLAAEKKRGYLGNYGRSGAARGWHFLTGDEPEIATLAEAVGFQYRFDERSGQFAHASGIVVITPAGRLSRYFYGIDYPTRDLRLGLVEASEHRIGSAVDQLLLFCFHYDPLTGKYSLAIMNILRLLGVATVLALGAGVVIMLRRERRASPESPSRPHFPLETTSS